MIHSFSESFVNRFILYRFDVYRSTVYSYGSFVIGRANFVCIELLDYMYLRNAKVSQRPKDVGTDASSRNEL